MEYNFLKGATKQPAFWAGLMNPTTAVIAVVGLITFLLITKEGEEKPLPTASKPLNQPLPNGSRAAVSTASQAPAKTAGEPLEALKKPDNEAVKQETIRRAMSELGKRSAEARARKRAERLNEE